MKFKESLNGMFSDAIMDGSHDDQAVKIVKDPLEMPQRPVTRGRTKKFKEDLQALVMNYQDGFGVHGDQVGGYFNIIEVQKDQGNVKIMHGSAPIS